MPVNIEHSKKLPVDNKHRVRYSKTNAERLESGESPLTGASRLSDSQGPPESESAKMLSDSIIIEPHRRYWLWKETAERLRRLDARAREGKSVDEASEFARWVQFSGLMHLFKMWAAPEPLKVSAEEIQQLINDVKYDCELHWKNSSRGPWVPLSELEAISQKLDRIAAKVATLSPPGTATVSADEGSTPALRVFEGGAS
jgi:hypothetical protein